MTVSQIETQFGVSPMTARRDLHELERRGLARRNHGGAVLPTAAAHEDSFDRRIKLATKTKQALAVAAAALIEPDETVFLDSSTTSYFVAKQIAASGNPITVLTNSLPIMSLLATDAGPNVEPDRRRRDAAHVQPVVRRRRHHADRQRALRRPAVPQRQGGRRRRHADRRRRARE